jgi:integrase
MKANKLPRLRRQKRAQGHDQSFVELNSVRVYCGPRQSPEAQQRYNKIIDESIARGRVLPAPQEDITVTELTALYTKHINREYADSQSVKDHTRLAVQWLVDVYGPLPVVEIGPVALKAVRERMIDKGNSITTINGNISVLKRILKYGAENELIPGEVYHRCAALSNLRRGRCRAKPAREVKPVPAKDVDKTLPFLTPSVRAAVQLQRLTGARSSEILNLKGQDIDRSGEVWIAHLAQHKTAVHGKVRTLCFGPKAQAILKPFVLKRKADEYLFSPWDHFEERKAATPPGKGRRPNQKPNPKKRNRTINDHYDSAAYGRCIRRACEVAGVTAWFPHQLRHLAATELRAAYGAEAARAVLGHANLKVTELYAEVDETVTIKIMAEIG